MSIDIEIAKRLILKHFTLLKDRGLQRTDLRQPFDIIVAADPGEPTQSIILIHGESDVLTITQSVGSTSGHILIEPPYLSKQEKLLGIFTRAINTVLDEDAEKIRAEEAAEAEAAAEALANEHPEAEAILADIDTLVS